MPPKPIVIDDLRGGRNDTDSPLALPMNQGVEVLNVDWRDTQFAHKRGGAIALALTGFTSLVYVVATLIRHIPGADEGLAELWMASAEPIMQRLAGGVVWTSVTLDDAISTRPQDVVGASLNGKFFLAYDSAVDRLHVWDPNLGTPRVRREGFATPAAPTAANQGAGAYAAVIRYYRVRWTQLVGSKVIRRSEAGPSVSFTPSGAGASVRVTQPTPPGEGETNWEIEASTDNSTWIRLYATRPDGDFSIAIATTFKDDNVAVSAYPVPGYIADLAGTYAVFPSVKYLITDGNRLLGLGAWEPTGTASGGKQSRLWFTPVLGSTDQGDDERLMLTTLQKNWVDLNESDGGGGTGLGGPINGVPYAFKYRQVWKIRPTGDVATPYLPRKIRDDIGCPWHKTICIGEDQIGRPALYFLSHRGPYRITADGDLQYLGRDNEVTWRSMNLAATNVVAHATFYPDKHQWWLWIATGSANDPDVKMMFDVQLGFPDQNGQVRGGWAKHTGDSANARASSLMSNTIGASMSRDLKPYLARSTGTTILKADTTDVDDNGTDFQAYVTSRPLLTAPDLLHKVGVAESILTAKALAGSDVTVTINRDFGKETRAVAVSLAPAAAETRVVKKVEGSEMGEADVIQMTIGDSAANEEIWTVDAIVVPVTSQEAR